MPVGDIEHRLAEMREFYPSDEHGVIDEAIETIFRLRQQFRKIRYHPSCREAIEKLNPSALFLDGLDGALVGYAIQWGSPALAVYDADRLVELLSKDMSHEEALAYYSFTIECAYLGPGTPLILHRSPEE